MKVFLTTTKLKKTAWEGQGWWMEAQYHMQACRSGEDEMRSHVALLFEDRPFQMRLVAVGARGGDSLVRLHVEALLGFHSHRRSAKLVFAVQGAFH